MNNKIIEKTEKLSFYLSSLMIPLTIYLVFSWVSFEKTMGAIQKIFYFHVGSAISSYLTILLLFCSSISYLLTKEKFGKLYQMWLLVFPYFLQV